MASLTDLFPLQLSTPRLTLDLFDNTNKAHYDCVIATFNTKTAHERMGDFGVRTPQQLDVFASRSKFQDPRLEGGIAERPLVYMVRLPPGATAAEYEGYIGSVNLATRVVNGGMVTLPPDIGWSFLEEHMGKGYATEAAKEVLRYTLEVFKPARGVMVFASGTNLQSNRVAEKLGFGPGGECKELDRPGNTLSLWILPGMQRPDEYLKDGISFKLES